MMNDQTKRLKLPLAIQLYSVRSRMQERFQETLQALADIGFKHIEWSGTFGDMPPAHLAEFLQKLDLRVMGMFAYMHNLSDPGSAVYDYARALRPEFLTVSSNITSETFSETLRQLQAAHRVVTDQGFNLTYHNHANEFQQLPDGRVILDALFEETAADNQQFLFDTFFAFYSGYDPCDYLRRYQGRIPQIHFNDMDPAGKSMALGAGSMKPSTELGTGCMDLPAIYLAAVKTGVRWVILEQHTLRDNPLDSARRNFEYCRKMIRDTGCVMRGET